MFAKFYYLFQIGFRILNDFFRIRREFGSDRIRIHNIANIRYQKIARIDKTAMNISYQKVCLDPQHRNYQLPKRLFRLSSFFLSILYLQRSCLGSCPAAVRDSSAELWFLSGGSRRSRSKDPQVGILVFYLLFLNLGHIFLYLMLTAQSVRVAKYVV